MTEEEIEANEEVEMMEEINDSEAEMEKLDSNDETIMEGTEEVAPKDMMNEAETEGNQEILEKNKHVKEIGNVKDVTTSISLSEQNVTDVENQNLVAVQEDNVDKTIEVVKEDLKEDLIQKEVQDRSLEINSIDPIAGEVLEDLEVQTTLEIEIGVNPHIK